MSPIVSRICFEIGRSALCVTLLAAGLSVSSVSQAQGTTEPTATLQAVSTEQILQDYVRAELTARATAATAAIVNQQLAKSLEAARIGLKLPADVTLSTGAFSTYPDYAKDGGVKGWVGRASVVVAGKNLQGVATAIEHLGKTLAVGSIQFSLSPEARLLKQRELLKKLGQTFKEKATVTAESFGFSSYKILSLDFTRANDNGPTPVMSRMNAAPMLGSSGPSVALEPSMTSVSVRVTGRISLH